MVVGWWLGGGWVVVECRLTNLLVVARGFLCVVCNTKQTFKHHRTTPTPGGVLAAFEEAHQAREAS